MKIEDEDYIYITGYRNYFPDFYTYEDDISKYDLYT